MQAAQMIGGEGAEGNKIDPSYGRPKCGGKGNEFDGWSQSQPVEP
jgi:hypothetical protein